MTGARGQIHNAEELKQGSWYRRYPGLRPPVPRFLRQLNGDELMLRMLLVAVAALSAPFVVAPAAHAAVDQSCALNEVITYSPPLTDTPQTVTFTVNGQLFNCSSSSASTGSYAETGTALNATCTSVLGAGSGTRVFNWTNQAIAPSTFSYNRTVSRVGGNIQVEAVGSIISGTFTPDPAKSVGTGAQPNPAACMTTGVSQLTAVGMLTIGI